jgi:hypothetical protein
MLESTIRHASRGKKGGPIGRPKPDEPPKEPPHAAGAPPTR